MLRLATFASYKNEKNVFLCKLSKAGFAYQGYDDALHCESCGFKSNNWSDVGDLFVQHAEHAPEWNKLFSLSCQCVAVLLSRQTNTAF